MEFTKQLLSQIRNGENAKVKSTLDNSYLCQSLDSFGAALVHYSADYGNAEVIEYLLEKGCNVNAQDSLGRTPLMRALAGWHESVIEVLLKAGSDFNTLVNYMNKSALQMVCADHWLAYDIRHVFLRGFRSTCSSSEEAAKKLIDAGCHLYQAVYTRDAKVVEYLLERGYSVDSMIPQAKITALHTAVLLEDVECTKVLLKYGADVKAIDMMNYSPLHYAYRHNMEHSAEKLDILQLLMSHNSPTDISQLVPTLKYGDSKSIRVVLSHLDVAAIDDSNDNNVLHYLSSNHNPGVINELKIHSHKCNVNAVNKWGMSPLIMAAIAGNVDMLQFLLNHGAMVDYVDYNLCRTPLCYAYAELIIKDEDRYYQCIELLLQHGADPQFSAVDKTGKQFTIIDVVSKSKQDWYKSLEPVIAQLAVLEEIGTPITEITRLKIGSHRKLKIHYEKCRRLLREEITASVTLLKLLVGSERNLEKYAGNEDLVLKLKRISEKQHVRSTFPYYFNTLTKRFSRGIQRRRLMDQAAGTICNIFENRIDQTHIAVGRISDYLDDQDLLQLCKL